MIKAFRADDRLIHGQVQTQWISTYGVNRVMIIDSNVVRDPINVQILKLAKPAGIDLVICDEEKAMNLIAKDAERGLRVLFHKCDEYAAKGQVKRCGWWESESRWWCST